MTNAQKELDRKLWRLREAEKHLENARTLLELASSGAQVFDDLSRVIRHTTEETIRTQALFDRAGQQGGRP